MASESRVPLVVDTPLKRWAWSLTALTILWNVVEAVVAIASGVAAGSIALVGFGLDSVVEVSSALVIVWFLSQHEKAESREALERKAVRLIAVAFGLVAVYVTYDALSSLAGFGEEPERSSVGIALVAFSLVVMPSLAAGKRTVARRMNSIALRADAAQTQLCTYLSGAVLLGLVANAALGWWWMDPVAGLVVATIALREARRAWVSGDLCEC